MNAISTDFAPPFKLIVPYFIIGVLFLFISVVFLLGLDTSNLHTLNPKILSWVHMFLLGFIMMIIFGAMAQLVPVVLEVGHFAVELYYVVYPLLTIGAILMSIGFVYSIKLLPYGGLIVLIALIIFIVETILTIIKVKKFNFIIVTVLIANIFLLIGILLGMLMALSYAGTIIIDINSMLQAHIYAVLVGYVGITIIGMSMVLLPMFWLSHEFSWKVVHYAVISITFGVLVTIISSIFLYDTITFVGNIITVIGLFLYLYQVYIVAKVRIRMIKDIYYKSMFVAFVGLVISVALGIYYIFFPSDKILLTIGWVVFLGFLTPMITGHMYKIIPFLVWFEKYSPLVGKQKVPALADMVQEKSAQLQLFFTTLGTVIITIALLNSNNDILYVGVDFLIVGIVFLIKDILFMLTYKGEKHV
jgi:hypothetical protein